MMFLFLSFSLLLRVISGVTIDGITLENHRGTDEQVVSNVNESVQTIHSSPSGFLAKFYSKSHRYMKERITVQCFDDLFYLLDVSGSNHTSHSPTWKWQQQRIYPVEAVITENECQTNEWKELDPGTTTALFAFVIIIALVLLGTACECISLVRKRFCSDDRFDRNTSPSKLCVRLLIAFSAYNNTKKLLDTSKATGELSCINGIRALSMMMIITGHTSIAMLFTYGRHNPLEYEVIEKKFWVQPVIQAPVFVDTFFFLTGFLVTYIVLDKAIKNGSFNIPIFYIHRLLRILPAMSLIAALTAGPHQLLGNGPLWNNSPYYVTEICQQAWWKTALLINTFLKDNTSMWICMPHAWYLSNEMVYYFLSPIILYFLVKKKASGSVIWLTLLIASHYFRWNAEKGVTHNIDNPYESAEIHAKMFTHVYIIPWNRPQPFLIGMLFGYLYYHKIKFHFNRLVQWLIRLLVTMTILYCTYGNYRFRSGMVSVPSKTTYVIEQTYAPTAWSICIGCIIMTCAAGNGGVMNKILAWKFFVPIGRLSFCAYLIHFNVLYQFANSRKHSLYYTFRLQGSGIITMNLAALTFAWMFSLLIESPILQIEKMILLQNQNPKIKTSKFANDSQV